MHIAEEDTDTSHKKLLMSAAKKISSYHTVLMDVYSILHEKKYKQNQKT